MLRLLKRRWGLSLLVVMLAVISVGMVKPGFYLMGWDNFSSYLNPGNILTTLFGAWRAYRGLGVPSDAEVTDVVRQVIDWLLSLVFGQQLADQLYLVLMLWGGVLGMYALGRKISRGKELFGFVAAFFYLFNLNTLAVFHFPMMMYNTRFLMLPTTTWVILNLIENKKISRLRYLGYLTLLLVGSGAYMVPTIFIVMMMSLGILLLVFRQRRSLVTVGFYVLLGAFWLLPFANYTIQKAEIVTQAPTFLEINDAMLNKPESYYAFERQAKLRPNFFDSRFTNRETNTHQAFHSVADRMEQGWTRAILWIFPVLYLVGAGYVLSFRRQKVLVWLALTTVVFLLLAKYGYLIKGIPIASTVFRFGDTKFHAMVVFAGAIMAAVVLNELARFKRLVFLGLGLLVVAHVWVYQSYFTGNLVGFFMYNQIPQAYFDVARVINEDPEPVRVVHLPLDKHAYWKPYKWGYFGSAFFNFMINKPLFDRSFEPASTENADVHQRLNEILHLADRVSDEALLEDRADELYQLLQSLSVRYVIDDQTISPYIDARNLEYWGKINVVDQKRLLAFMEKRGDVEVVQESDIQGHKLRLLRLKVVEPRVQFLGKAEKVNSQHLVVPSDSHYIQAKEFDKQALVYPFSADNPGVEIEGDRVKITALGWEVTVPIVTSKYTQVIDLKQNEMNLRSDEECGVVGRVYKFEKTDKGVLSVVAGCRNFVQKSISFASDVLYLWSVKYTGLSGSTPMLILTGKLDEYFLKKLYLSNGSDRVSGFLKPRADLQDYGDKQLIIQHASENEGKIELEQVALVELPKEWVDYKIVPDGYQSEKFSGEGRVVSYKQLLPSLWRIKTDAQEGEFLLKFNEQYDGQWKIVGVPTVFQARCDGYVNCYKVKLGEGESTFYIFYWPELLSWVGLVVTGLSVVGGFVLYSKR